MRLGLGPLLLPFLVAVLVAGTFAGTFHAPSAAPMAHSEEMVGQRATASTPAPVTNFTSTINRLVELVALAGSGILALVWARVAMSWFSNDISKKIQAKDRARDALVGTLVFTAAITGLVWGLAQWVLTGV